MCKNYMDLSKLFHTFLAHCQTNPKLVEASVLKELKAVPLVHFASGNALFVGLGSLSKKNGIMWEKFPNWGGGSDPNPLLDVYLPSNFWHAKMILRYY